MTRSRAQTLLLVGSTALTLSGCASYGASASDSNYASDSVASACSLYDDPGCAYGYPYGLYDYGGGWWPHDGWRHDNWRHGDYHANGHAMAYDSGHGGFGHGGFRGGGVGGVGGHGR